MRLPRKTQSTHRGTTALLLFGVGPEFLETDDALCLYHRLVRTSVFLSHHLYVFSVTSGHLVVPVKVSLLRSPEQRTDGVCTGGKEERQRATFPTHVHGRERRSDSPIHTLRIRMTVRGPLLQRGDYVSRRTPSERAEGSDACVNTLTLTSSLDPSTIHWYSRTLTPTFHRTTVTLSTPLDPWTTGTPAGPAETCG